MRGQRLLNVIGAFRHLDLMEIVSKFFEEQLDETFG